MITEKMVEELNTELEAMGCCFRYIYNEKFFADIPTIHITPISTTFLSSYVLNPTKEFFQWIKLWFTNKGVRLCLNNDGSIMWGVDMSDNGKE